MATDFTFLKNAYPTAEGSTLGTFFKEQPGVTAEVAQEKGSEVEKALSIGGQASPLIGLVVFAAMVILVYLLAKQFGEDGDFSDIRASAYNAIFISAVAVAGIPIWKFLFTKVPLPGVTPWVLSV